MNWTTNGRRIFDNTTGWCADCITETEADRVAERHNAQLAACAAGPWRADVENAPKGEWLMGSYKGRWSQITRLSDNKWIDEFGVRKTPDAFAVPNPPQVTT